LFPLSDGAEVFIVRKAVRKEGNPPPEVSFTLELAFGEGAGVRGEEVLSTLERLLAAVEDVVERFRPVLAVAE
jgi:hypothetical protein